MEVVATNKYHKYSMKYGIAIRSLHKTLKSKSNTTKIDLKGVSLNWCPTKNSECQPVSKF